METLNAGNISAFPQKALSTFRDPNQPSAFTQVVSLSRSLQAIQVEPPSPSQEDVDPLEALVADANTKVRCTIKVLRNGEHKRIDVLNKTAVRALKRYYV